MIRSQEESWRIVLQVALDNLPADDEAGANEIAQSLTEGVFLKGWNGERLYEEIVRDVTRLQLIRAAAVRVVEAEEARRRGSGPSQLRSKRLQLEATRDHEIDNLRQLVKP